MFDFGFWELAMVTVVALLVVGPERLPALAGQIGKWVGKAKRMIASVRSDIESEIKAVELKEILEKQQGEIGELKEMLKAELPENIPYIFISAIAQQGITELKDLLWETLNSEI